MPDPSVRNFLAALEAAYPGMIRRYGSAPDEEHGVGFRIQGVPAVFSVLTLEGSLPADTYDVQIESYPPGEYIYTAQVSLDQLMDLIRKYFGDPRLWPEIEPAG